LKQLNKDGWKIVIFTNQNGVAKGKKKILEFLYILCSGKQKDTDLTGKIVDICAQIGFPMQAFMATGKDSFRKPSKNFFIIFENNY
jgi:bifunctional polynucleotide phosphatase/kinase